MIEQRKKAEQGGRVTQYYAGIHNSFLSKHTALLSAINCRGYLFFPYVSVTTSHLETAATNLSIVHPLNYR
jgi:hypothetical protein